jgi:hypothetical protein
MPPAGSRPLGPPHQALLGTWPHNSSTSSGSTYEHKATPALPGCGASAGGGTVPRTGQLPWAQAPAAAAGGGRGSMSGAGAAGSLISSRAYPSGVPAAAPGPAELFTTAGALLQQGQDRQQQAVPTGPPMHGNNLSYTTSGTGAHNSTGGWPHPNWSSHTAAGAYGGPNGSSSTAGYGRLSGGQRHSYQQQQQQQQQQGWAAPAQQQQVHSSRHIPTATATAGSSSTRAGCSCSHVRCGGKQACIWRWSQQPVPPPASQHCSDRCTCLAGTGRRRSCPRTPSCRHGTRCSSTRPSSTGAPDAVPTPSAPTPTAAAAAAAAGTACKARQQRQRGRQEGRRNQAAAPEATAC